MIKSSLENGIAQNQSVNFGYLSGLVSKHEIQTFKRILFRATRGKVLCRINDSAVFEHEDEQKLPAHKRKCVFVLLFQDVKLLNQKTKRICATFSEHEFELPKQGRGSQQEYDEVLTRINQEMVNTNSTLSMSEQQLQNYIHESLNLTLNNEVFSLLTIYTVYAEKERRTYTTMNKMRQNNNLFITYFWSPRENVHHSFSVKELLEVNIDRINFKRLKPPTHFETNEFTFLSQLIVNTYGTPAFGEVNPAVVTNVTFPFLFGVMFGDIGHGALLLVFASILCFYRDALINNPNFEGLVAARYMLLLMGFFALYMGLIYNDFMSMPLSLFGPSCYQPSGGSSTQLARTDRQCVYPFGLDPVWMASTSDISFYNSFKMKMSVIVGVAHMLMGVVMKGANAVHFNKRLDLLHEAVPQFLLLVCLFGFMDFLVVKKWLTDYTGMESRAPGVITVIINVFLNQGRPDPKSNEVNLLVHQEFWSRVMLYIALVAPPWMLLVKPLTLKGQHLERKIERRRRGGDFELSASPKHDNKDDEDQLLYPKIEMIPV